MFHQKVAACGEQIFTELTMMIKPANGAGCLPEKISMIMKNSVRSFLISRLIEK
jgi:hypothetical protein